MLLISVSARGRRALSLFKPKKSLTFFQFPCGQLQSFPRTEVMHLNTLKDLYIHELKDLYSVEKQLIAALPKMAKTAKNDSLASGFREHLEQTREHAARLEKILAGHEQSTRGK